MELNYPVGFEMAVNLTKFEMEKHLCLMAALKMFELGKFLRVELLNLQGCQELFEVCSQYKISIFNYNDEEIASELDSDLMSIQKVMV